MARPIEAALGLTLALAVPGVGAGPAAPDAPAGTRIGIEGRFFSREDIAHLFNLDPGGGGVLVERVVPGSRAEAAGLQGGDVPVTLDREPVLLGGDLIVEIDGDRPCRDYCLLAAPELFRNADRVVVRFLRNARPMEVEIPGPGAPASPDGPVAVALAGIVPGP